MELPLTRLLGTPLNELQIRTGPDTVQCFSKAQLTRHGGRVRAGKSTAKAGRNPSSIHFVRNRTFYARAALNARGRVTFGLRHIRKPHVQELSLVCLNPR